jgi:hypothetical protein
MKPIYLGTNKYNAQIKIYNGFGYHSKREADYAQDLDLLKKGKAITDWDRQFSIDLVAGGVKICTHKVDFRVLHNDGRYELVEVKGKETGEWRLKRKLLEAVWLPEHPEYRYTVVR